jgi:hypothetical protein
MGEQKRVEGGIYVCQGRAGQEASGNDENMHGVMSERRYYWLLRGAVAFIPPPLPGHGMVLVVSPSQPPMQAARGGAWQATPQSSHFTPPSLPSPPKRKEQSEEKKRIIC